MDRSKLLLLAVAGAGALAAALPAVAQEASGGLLAVSATELAREPATPFWVRAAARYGRCVAKADAAASIRYIRAEAGSVEEANARAALKPVFDRCEFSLGAWERDVDEAARRLAVRAALVRERML